MDTSNLPDLEKYISETLIQIKKGVMLSKDNGVSTTNLPTSVEFDITVLSSKSESSEIKGGFVIKVLELGGKENSNNTNNVVNKLKFNIPILFK